MKKLLNKAAHLSAFFALLACFSCTGENSTSSSSSSKKKIFREGNGEEIQGIDPHEVTGVQEHHVIISIIEGLISTHPETLEPLPGVAESWTLSEDQKVYTFKIRPTAKWTTGEALTADDFVYSWKRVLTPAFGAEYAYMLHAVLNAEEFNKGTLKDFSQVGVKALDPQTLQVTLKNPTSYFLAQLQHYATYPVHKTTIEKFNAFSTRGTKWTRPENFVGNGPFKLKSWELNKMLVVEKNPLYWNNAVTKLDEIQFQHIGALQTEERMYRSGELDKTLSIPINKIEVYQKERPKEFKNYPVLGTYLYRLNVTRPQLKDPRVRKALAMGIDRVTLVEKVTKGGEKAATSLMPPFSGGYTAKEYAKFDLPEARRLLKEAGFENGKGFKGVEILYNTLESHRAIAEAIQQMWKINLGINVTLKNQEWKVFIDSQQKKDYDVGRFGWSGDFADPSTFADLWLTDGGNNNTGWANPKYDALVAKAKATLDPTQRNAFYQEAEDIFSAEMPAIPIYFYTAKYLLSEKVTGWYPNILDWHPYQYVDID